MLYDFHSLAALRQSVIKSNGTGKYLSMPSVCASCIKLRQLSNPSSVAIPSHVITAKRFDKVVKTFWQTVFTESIVQCHTLYILHVDKYSYQIEWPNKYSSKKCNFKVYLRAHLTD